MSVPCARAASRIFEYPSSDYPARLSELEQACRAYLPSAADCLSEMRSQLADLSVGALRELYTRTFDLTPVCAPYLSVHLFGEGSFKRAQLMTGLAELYAAKGIPSSNELPDHLGVVLGAIEQLDPPERRDLLIHCLKTSLEKMRAELVRQNNPYALAMSALDGLCSNWIQKTEVSCD